MWPQELRPLHFEFDCSFLKAFTIRLTINSGTASLIRLPAKIISGLCPKDSALYAK